MNCKLIISTIIVLCGLFSQGPSVAATEEKTDESLFEALPTVFSATYGPLKLQSLRPCDVDEVVKYWKEILHSGITGKNTDGTLSEETLRKALDNQLRRLANSNPFAYTLAWLGETLIAVLQMGVQPISKYSKEHQCLTDAFSILVGTEYVDSSDGASLEVNPDTYKTGIGVCSIAIQERYFSSASVILNAGAKWFKHFGKTYNLPLTSVKPSIVSAIIDPILGEHYKTAGFTVLTDDRWHRFYEIPRSFAVLQMPETSAHSIDWEKLGSSL